MLGSENNTPNTNDESSANIETFGLGEKISVGNFEYTFKSKSEKIYVGSNYFKEYPDGIFYVFDIEVENIGNQADYINNEIYLIDNQGREFEQDDEAWIHLNNNFVLEELNPGLIKRGQIIFDVPKGTQGKLGIKNSAWSSDFSAYVSF